MGRLEQQRPVPRLVFPAFKYSAKGGGLTPVAPKPRHAATAAAAAAAPPGALFHSAFGGVTGVSVAPHQRQRKLSKIEEALQAGVTPCSPNPNPNLPEPQHYPWPTPVTPQADADAATGAGAGGGNLTAALLGRLGML